ncbi:hypothetical protein [Actinophytocola xanthii]|uniref:Uncharacterized protein n=1 Tax=Actinophytocola xanthii TaxID=1912961 RepID=A0A1Q8CMN2_9PSEU|nr:hypothetical protein [Actinophytocola xanthii]OLF15618.1 hypothetical protein BU204_21125 [Actinophytocola xanthii]
MEQEQVGNMAAAEQDVVATGGEAPPPMPVTTATPAPSTPEYGWAVDPDRMRAFVGSVTRARSFLDAVQAKVSRMQGADFTPQLGTSPVGQQLAKKFDDRLNSTSGLRAMLEEAMRRMQTFIASAEAAARSYNEMDETAKAKFDGILPDVGGLLKDVVADLATSGPGGTTKDNPYDDHGTYGDHDHHDDHDEAGDDQGGGPAGGEDKPGSGPPAGGDGQDGAGGKDQDEAGSGQDKPGSGRPAGGDGQDGAGDKDQDEAGSGQDKPDSEPPVDGEGGDQAGGGGQDDADGEDQHEAGVRPDQAGGGRPTGGQGSDQPGSDAQNGEDQGETEPPPADDGDDQTGAIGQDQAEGQNGTGAAPSGDKGDDRDESQRQNQSGHETAGMTPARGTDGPTPTDTRYRSN